jgi:hypothetical protein
MFKEPVDALMNYSGDSTEQQKYKREQRARMQHEVVQDPGLDLSRNTSCHVLTRTLCVLGLCKLARFSGAGLWNSPI